MKEKNVQDETAQYEREKQRKKQTLLQKFELPVEHLDFNYVKNCQNSKEVERILRVLRSGEEGHFPDLEKCTAERLAQLNPKSRHLRVEIPILRSKYLEKTELDELKKNFLDWVDEIETEGLGSEKGTTKEIFTNDFCLPDDIPPIRGLSKVKQEKKSTEKTVIPSLNIEEEPGFIRTANPNRIKSWDYDKWNKFDVETELTKLDIERMQHEEWDNSVDKKKLKEEQDLVAKLMKNEEYPARDKKSKSIFSTSTQRNPKNNIMKEILSVNTIEEVEEEKIPELENAPGNLLQELQQIQNFSVNKMSETPSNSNARQTESFNVSTSKNSVKLHTNNVRSFSSDPHKKSFIEEINDNGDDSKGKTERPCTSKEIKIHKPQVNGLQQKEEPKKGKRRFKIQIDDIHVA